MIDQRPRPPRKIEARLSAVPLTLALSPAPDAEG